MPNSLSSTGLTIASQAELLANFTAALQAAYGSGINLSSNSPDGQMMNIYIQAQLDVEELLLSIYNSFDPDNAVGVVLDQRVAINGLVRQIGTYTLQNISVVTSQSVNLYGLDQSAQSVFTVADNAGTQWNLISTQLGVATGTHSFAFQAALPGAVSPIPNTINVPVTIVLGVTSINNPTTYTTLGINEESDAALKLRRAKSVSIASQGYLSGLLAALYNTVGISSAYVYENNTNATNSDGVPAHSIWVIVAGTATPAAIAQAIYTKRNAGAGMYSFVGTSYTLTQADGSSFQVFWDYVAAQTLFITMTVTSINGVTAPLIAAIQAGVAASFVPGVNATVDVTELGTVVQKYDPNALVTSPGYTAALVQTLVLSGSPASGTFTLTYAGATSAAVNWNDSTATIQTKVQAVTGLSAATVSGSLASQTLTVTLNTTTAAGLIYASANSLQTAAPAAVSFTYVEGFANQLSPSTKRKQFTIAPANVIILPMQMSPASASVAHTATQTFLGLGGYAPYAYSLLTNASGGSINASSGLYTAGSVSSVTDFVRVTDALGNTATAAVAVT